MNKHVIFLEGKPFLYTIERSQRRHIGLYIRPEGLLVKAPSWVQESYIEESLIQKSRWILQKTSDLKQRQASLQAHQTRWEDGGKILFFGIYYTLKCCPSNPGIKEPTNQPAVTVNHPRREINITVSSGTTALKIKSLCKAWLYEEARSHIGMRLEVLRQYAVSTPLAWRLAYAKSRWGSCTRDRRLMFNWRLIHFDEAIIDYVIAHELAHLKEMNHSAHFWAEVERILPNYHSAKEHLRKFDTALLPDFSRSAQV